MTTRRVAVTLELETDMPLASLASAQWWRRECALTVVQAQANVIRAKPASGRARKRTRRR